MATKKKVTKKHECKCGKGEKCCSTKKKQTPINKLKKNYEKKITSAVERLMSEVTVEDVYNQIDIAKHRAQPFSVKFVQTKKEMQIEALKPCAYGKLSRNAELKVSDNLKNAKKDIPAAIAFNTKWIKEMMHGSLCDLPTFELDIKNASILLSKIIEDTRKGTSYMESSTRYLALMTFTSPFKGNNKEYEDVCRRLLANYLYIKDHMSKLAEYAELTEEELEYDSIYHGLMSALETKNKKILDSARYYLPASIVTNIGVKFNLRALPYFYSKLVESELEEAQELAAYIKNTFEADELLASLIDFDNIVIEKSIREDEHTYGTPNLDVLNKFMSKKTQSNIYMKPEPIRNECFFLGLENVNKQYFLENEISIIGHDKKDKDMLKLIKNSFSRHTDTIDFKDGRILESILVKVDTTMDFGAFRDIQRHRAMTILKDPFNHGMIECKENPEFLTKLHFYSPVEKALLHIHSRIDNIGIGDNHPIYNLVSMLHKNLEKAHVKATEEAFKPGHKVTKKEMYNYSYMCPLGSAKRFIIYANLRQIFKMCKLRMGHGAHLAYRNWAMSVLDEVLELLKKL